MKSQMPTLRDVKKLKFREQRRKNIIPHDANLFPDLNLEILNLRKKLLSEPSNSQLKTILNETVLKKKEIEEQRYLLLQRRLEKYIAYQPEKIRLTSRKISGKYIKNFNSNKKIQKIFDQYCAHKLREVFEVNSIGRDQALRVLIDMLNMNRGSKSNNSPSVSVISLDFESFFEQIDQALLLNKVWSHAGVPSYVKKHIRSLLAAHNNTGEKTDRGIPRGIATSSALAEIYLESFDRRIRTQENIALYLRYVDDVLIIAERAGTKKIKELLEKEMQKLGLNINSEKGYKVLCLGEDGADLHTFDFLGYSFGFDERGLASIDITEKREKNLGSGLSNCIRYAESIKCWADKDRVNFLFAMLDYLLLPHVSKQDDEHFRIVSGLAYNARFLLLSPENLKYKDKIKSERLACLMIQARRGLLGMKAIKDVSRTGKCQCCQNKAHRVEHLTSLRRTHFDLLKIMTGPTRQHKPNAMREDVKEELWKK